MRNIVIVSALFEQELMCRVRQLESHVKQLQNIVIKNDVSTSQPVAGRRKPKTQREIDFNKYVLNYYPRTACFLYKNVIFLATFSQ